MGRPTIGVLVSLPEASRAADPVDLRSGADILRAVEALGCPGVLLRADDDLDVALRQTGVDACILALHGRLGGSGETQALLTMRGIPFCGPGAASTALAFDKVRSRQLLAYHNLPVPAAVALGGDPGAPVRGMELLGRACVLKPRRGALGRGVTRISDPADIEAAVDLALAEDDELVLERCCLGPEIQVVIIDDRVLGMAAIDRDGGMVCPPELSRAQRDGLSHIGLRAARALGLSSGPCRVDVVLTERHNEVVLEVEPLPPLHRDGAVARVARAAGLDHAQLVARLLAGITGRASRPRGRELEPVRLQ
jgi:D-alanine-D-alanine ligase